MYAGVLFLALPIALHITVVGLLRERTERSWSAARFHQRRGPTVSPIVVGFAAIALYLQSAEHRAQTVFLVLVISSLAGSELVIQLLLRTFARITRFSLDPSEWSSFSDRGPRWRYQMRHQFIEDPEYVDALVLSMLQSFSTYTEFVQALRDEDFPRKYKPLLHRRLWGVIQPTVQELAREVVPNDVFTNNGRYSSGNSPEEIFHELRYLCSCDRISLMDRWQYYWCLRNLNLINRLLRRAFSGITLLCVILLGSAVALAVLVTTGHPVRSQSADVVLRALTAGTLLWVLFTCAGASILIVRIFQGTGAFAIDTPCRSTRFDPLWSRIVKIGILSFTVSFIVYGIGSPFLLEPAVLSNFHVSNGFLGYAIGSSVLCGIVFVTHSIGLHDLMLGSRENALDRVMIDLKATTTPGMRQFHVERFREIRDLQVWPLRRSTLAQLAAGILLPITVQVLLLYAGLRGG